MARTSFYQNNGRGGNGGGNTRKQPPGPRVIQLPSPHTGQRIVRAQARQNNFLCAGRRWRKSSMLACIAIEAAIQGKRVFWGAPTYQNIEPGWEECLKACWHLVDAKIVQFNQSRMTAYFPDGGRITFRSLEDPDNVRGGTSDIAIIDEMGHRQLQARAYYQVVRPTLADTHGPFWGIGTPDGMGVFFEEVQYALSGCDPDSIAWCVPTVGAEIQYDDSGRGTLVRRPHPLENDSGAVTFEWLQDEFRRMPERMFRSEYLAEFIDDAGGVFRRVEAAVIAGMTVNTPYSTTSHYQGGVDIGRTNDYTVISIMDCTTWRQAYFERFNKIDWPLIYSRIARAADEYNCPMYVDATAMGDHVPRELMRRGVAVVPIKFGSQSKANIIDHLASIIEQCKKPFLQDRPDQTFELRAYQYDRTPSGLLRTAAPKGEKYHDDCVTALALSCWERRPPDESPILWEDEDVILCADTSEFHTVAAGSGISW